MTWGDVELVQNKAVINQTKIDDHRVAQLSPPVIAALANTPSIREPDSLVFHYAYGESVGQVWNNVIERAGIEKLSPYCCRHGFATSMLRAGIDPKTVANYTEKALPTDTDVPVFIEKVFSQFYRDMFCKTVGRAGGIVMEYAWDMSWCEPCAADPLSNKELRALGVRWARREGTPQNVYVTHLRA